MRSPLAPRPLALGTGNFEQVSNVDWAATALSGQLLCCVKQPAHFSQSLPMAMPGSFLHTAFGWGRLGHGAPDPGAERAAHMQPDLFFGL